MSAGLPISKNRVNLWLISNAVNIKDRKTYRSCDKSNHSGWNKSNIVVVDLELEVGLMTSSKGAWPPKERRRETLNDRLVLKWLAVVD